MPMSPKVKAALSKVRRQQEAEFQKRRAPPLTAKEQAMLLKLRGVRAQAGAFFSGMFGRRK